MWVFILKATLEINQRTAKPLLVQIHLTMLPNKRIRFRTRAKPADNAMFAEEFFCKVSPGMFATKKIIERTNEWTFSFSFDTESIQTQGIRFRLYSNERFKREKLLAESTVMFGLVNLDEDMCKIIPLERAYVISSSHHCELNMLGNQRMRFLFF